MAKPGVYSQGSNTSEVEQMTCFVIKSPKNNSYWAGVIVLLNAIVILEKVPGYTAAGFLLSFLVACENDPVATLKKIAKVSNFSIKIITFKINNDIIVLDNEARFIYDEYMANVGHLNQNSGLTAIISMHSLCPRMHAPSTLGAIRHIIFIAAKSVTNPNESAAYGNRKISILIKSRSING